MNLLVIPWDVNPEIFRIGSFAIRWYGLLFASSFLFGYIIMDKAYLAILPGVAIMLLVLAFNLLGNSLQDALDPKAVERK